MTIREHLQEIRIQMEESCRKAGRDPKEVTLIAVSKTKPVDMLQEAYQQERDSLGKIRSRNCWERFLRCRRMWTGISSVIFRPTR